MNTDKKNPGDLAAVPSQTEKGEVIEAPQTCDAVFGTITEDGPNYRNVYSHHLTWCPVRETHLALGWMDRVVGPHDEVPAGAGRIVDSGSF